MFKSFSFSPFLPLHCVVVILVVWMSTLSDPDCCLSTCLPAAGGQVEGEDEREAVCARARCEHKINTKREGGGERRGG